MVADLVTSLGTITAQERSEWPQTIQRAVGNERSRPRNVANHKKAVDHEKKQVGGVRFLQQWMCHDANYTRPLPEAISFPPSIAARLEAPAGRQTKLHHVAAKYMS